MKRISLSLILGLLFSNFAFASWPDPLINELYFQKQAGGKESVCVKIRQYVKNPSCSKPYVKGDKKAAELKKLFANRPNGMLFSTSLDTKKFTLDDLYEAVQSRNTEANICSMDSANLKNELRHMDAEKVKNPRVMLFNNFKLRDGSSKALVEMRNTGTIVGGDTFDAEFDHPKNKDQEVVVSHAVPFSQKNGSIQPKELSVLVFDKKTRDVVENYECSVTMTGKPTATRGVSGGAGAGHGSGAGSSNAQ